MSVRMKAPRIEQVEVKIGNKKPRFFVVPKEKAESVAQLLGEYEQSARKQFVAAEDVFSELDHKYSRPGAVLKGARLKAEMSQVELSQKLGIDQADLSKMENGTRSIGKVIAKRLAKVLGVDYRVFL